MSAFMVPRRGSTGKRYLAVLALLWVYATAQVFYGAMASDECQALGYKTSRSSLTFSLYCVTRIDQSDVAVPIARARLEPIQ